FKQGGKKMETIAEGKYILNFKVLHKELDQAATMANYIADSAVLTKGADILTINLMLIDSQIVLVIKSEDKYNGSDQINQKMDDEKNRRYELYELEEISEIMGGRVQYELGYEGRIIKGDEELRLEFDLDNLEPIE